MIKRFKRKQVW